MTITQDERNLRAALVNADITLDALERYPLRWDLGWDRLRITMTKAHIAAIKREIATLRILTERAP